MIDQTFIHRLLKQQEGYTLAETLVAGALLTAVLIPAMLFLGQITARQNDRDRLIAMQLAREAMDKTIALSLYSDNEEKIILQNTAWQIIRVVDIRDGLAEIQITVHRLPAGQKLAELKTLQYL